MRQSRILVAVSVALLLTVGLAGSLRILVHHARGLTSSGYIIAGLSDSRIYRSADWGATWEEADYGLPLNEHGIWSLAVAPNPTRIYAVIWRTGLYFSSDQGTHWRPVGESPDSTTLSGDWVTVVVVDPRDSRHLFAFSEGTTFNESRDGGQHWSARSLPTASPVTTSALDSHRAGSLLVGTFADGLLISIDDGATWTHATGLPIHAEVQDVAFDPRHPRLAYAGTTRGFYRSTDGGRSWRRQGRPFAAAASVAVDPSGLAGVLVGSYAGDGIARSQDGLAWRQASVPHTDGNGITAFAFDPAHPTRILAGMWHGDLLVSTDSGASWRSAPKLGGNSADVWRLATTSRTGRRVSPITPPSGVPASVGAPKPTLR